MSGSQENKNDMPSQNSFRSYEVSQKRVLRQKLKSDDALRYFLLDYIAYSMGVVLILAVLCPALAFPLSALFLAAYFISHSTKKYTQWALHAPVYLISPEIIMQRPSALEKKSKKEKGAGLIYLGNDMDRNGKALWFSKKELTTHMILFGKTGSGKTELLLSMMYQYIVLGSGFIYVDGKGSINTWTKLYSIAKQLGLEDNLLVLNFFSGDKLQSKNEKTSNTLNPFAEGSSDVLMEMLSGMMGVTGGENTFWRDRAEALGRCLLRALCELRDQGQLELSVEAIRENLPLDRIEELSIHDGLSDFTKSSISYYLNDLPGWRTYKEATGSKEKMQAALEVNKQHGFLMMQYTSVLQLLSGSYGHITKTSKSEIDFLDVITHRRILYVMLPSLQKSPESLKHLGSLVVTSLRNALSKLLGSEHLTGSKEKLIDNKAFNANVPYGLFLDEYGSYCVEGFADMAAQARELNVSLCFAGQDYASFKQGSEKEAARINANTSIKIFMQTDCKETKDLASDRAGQAYTYLADQMKPHSKGDQGLKEGRLQLTDRITFEQLYSQQPGECHVMYGEKLWRVKSFYGDFKISQNYQINHFIKLKPQSSKIPQETQKEEATDKLNSKKRRKLKVDVKPSELPL
jgi:energy-coupling factor transporter ATP-binding protein EcfA2